MTEVNQHNETSPSSEYMLDTDEYFQLLSDESEVISGFDTDQLNYEVFHLGWRLQDVIGHTGWVFRYAASCLQAADGEKPSRSAIGEPPPGEDVLGWYNDARELILDRLHSTPLDVPRPTWAGSQPAGWWLRRMSHEAAMHRWDAVSAVRTPEPIDSRHARDGVDEILQYFVPRRTDFAKLAGDGDTLHLHATDLDAEWMLTFNSDSIEWTHVHGKGDAAARAPMSDLLLLLWGRIPPSRIEIFGAVEVVERWQAASKF